MDAINGLSALWFGRGNNTEKHSVFGRLAELKSAVSGTLKDALGRAVSCDKNEKSTGCRSCILHRAVSNFLSKPSSIETNSSPLCKAIGYLKALPLENSREAMDVFFDKFGTELFSNNNLCVSKQETLDFCQYFKRAIFLEAKEGKGYRKLKERLDAISFIEEEVRNKSAEDCDSGLFFTLAIQCCGRTREKVFVTQRRLPLCPLFAILTAGWKSQPLKMVKIAMGFAKTGEFDQLSIKQNLARRIKYSDRYETVNPEVRTQVQAFFNEEANQWTPDLTQSLRKETPDPYIDQLIMLGLWEVDEGMYSTSTLETIQHVKDLGMVPYSFAKRMDTPKEDEVMGRLSTASERKVPVIAGMGFLPAMVLSKIISLHPSVLEFRNNKDKVYDFDEISKVVEIKNMPRNAAGHAVVIDNFSFDEEKVYMKILTWGKAIRISISRETFNNTFMTRRFVFCFDKDKWNSIEV